jgi:hypothetical protein
MMGALNAPFFLNSMNYKRSLLALFAIWLLLRIASFTLVHMQWSDIPIYERYATSLFGGQTPYTDFNFEYPPVAVVIFAIPGIFATYFGHFDFFYRLFMLLFDLGNLLLLGGLARLLFRHDNKKIIWVLGSYIVLTAISFQFVLDRFDLAVAFMILLSLYLSLVRKQWFLAYSVIWIATLAKLFPVILIPLLFGYQYLNFKDRSRAFLDFSYSVAFLILIFMTFFAWCGPWWNMVLAYHGERGLQIESLYSSLLLIGKLFGGAAEIIRGFGAFELNASGALIWANIALPLIGLLIIGIYIIFWRVLSQRKKAEHPDYLIKAILSCLLVFVTFNKVLSPQYLLWLFPLAALAAPLSEFKRVYLACWLLIAVMTAILFPFNYVSLLELHALGIILLIVRNLALLTSTGLTLKGIWK